jgi:hypothetical protein
MVRNKNSYDIIISCDPGITGGTSILENKNKFLIHKMPIKQKIVNKKKKNVYNMEALFEIFSKYQYKKVLFCIERQGVRPGEGAVSAMTIGKGFGQLIGLAYGMGFDVVEISPVTWKKEFPELVTQEIKVIKSEIKNLRAESKTIKDKDAKKQNKKQIEKLNRQVKFKAKTTARELVSYRYPQFVDYLKKKNTDGMAESLLIALYGRNKQDELVQESQRFLRKKCSK